MTTAHAYRNFEHAQDIISYFEWLCDEECRRLERCGLEANVALGVNPDARPHRRHPELWTELPELLERPEVVAVGEIGAWEDSESHWELFNRQLELARQTDVAVIATPPKGLKANMTYKMMQRVDQRDLDSKRVLMNFLDERLIETVVRDGFVAGVTVGAGKMEPRAAARVVADTIESVGHADRIVLNSALRAGSADVLSVPKFVSALDDMGLDEAIIDQLAWSNAARLFGVEED